MKTYNFWFVVGTQHLYGEEIFEQIEKHGKEIATFLNHNTNSKTEISYKCLVKTSREIYDIFQDANYDETCHGIVTWMHTFSPSKMWIRGLKILDKPILHLHTQYNREIPWGEIDMDFMNLNQSAHGDKEHGYIFTRMRKYRKVISGYYKNKDVSKKLENWMKAAVGVYESNNLNIVRFGDNMRNVAVTEGDKVGAEIQFGWSINGYGVGDLADFVSEVTSEELQNQMEKYKERYLINTKKIKSIEYQAKLEIGIRKFLKENNAGGFTTTFEDLHNLEQLPGLAVQDLMNEGYGFGAEGDWKTAALLRIMKLMSLKTVKGTTFMEDYTYHLPENSELVLGAHMLEVCPSIANSKPKIEVHDLGIGGKEAPARLVFDANVGKALQVTLIDLGERFRMIIAECEAVKMIEDMPNLPVARVLWKSKPSFSVATEAWILAGGAHHTVMTYDLEEEALKNFAEMTGIECVCINDNTDLERLKQELLLSDYLYKARG